MSRGILPLCALGMSVLLIGLCATGWAQEYEVGGPLAGLKLPPMPTQHGERPGYPGDLPGKYDGDPLQPVLELNPGSPELYRNYWFKYCPVRSFFDRQSRLKNWVAPNIPTQPAAAPEMYAAPLYHVPRHAAVVNTGLKWKPVPVIRCRTGSPVIKLDLGTLDVGVYAVRLIAAVETEKLRTFRLPLYLRATINDGLAGEENSYRIRLGYCDEFYSIAEVYFHATSKRAYRAELVVDEGSQVDVLVHEVSLDDVLAGVERTAIKTRTTLHTTPPPEPKTVKQVTPEERLRRDAAIWNAFPRINAQGAHLETGGDEHVFRPNVTIGVPGKTAKEIADEFGAWQSGGYEAFMINRKLNLTYTFEDMHLGRKLPDPYPYKDDGAGLFFPNEADPGKGHVWAPIAAEVSARIRGYASDINRNAETYRRTGDLNAARDGAMQLVRLAYAFPTLDFANFLVSVTRDPGPYGRDWRCRRREATAMFYPHYPMYVDPILYDYDKLFDYIQKDEDLAKSVGRFVPWVKTPQDVIKLIDVYLVQTTAKRILRYHYYTDPMDIANAASVVGDTKVTDPWMEWLFTRTFIYPLPPVGIQDAMITGCDRDGCEYIGSTYYAQGEGAMRVAESLKRYLKSGGNPKYDLTDPARYPKAIAQCYWRIANVVAGSDFLRIGDVCGPDKTAGHTLRDLEFARNGWSWTGDPRFAFILKHYAGRKGETDEEWRKVEEAAAQCRRAPWLDNRSRVMPMWAGVLETGTMNDDPRLRAAAYLRLGFGIGHGHADTLDLQMVAQGLPATIDGGQRPGYSTPGDGNTFVHNLVEVDGKANSTYSWARALTDAPGARYLHAEAMPPSDARLYRRQIALVDVDQGSGAQPVAIAQQRPPAKLPAGVVPANAYLFDVVRVGGGKVHTYCFHGTVDDQFQWNALDVKPVGADDTPAGKYLARFKNLPDRKFAGTAPDTLEATWRQSREKVFGSEQMHAGEHYSDAAPRRYTRLHLLDVNGARAMQAALDCFQWKYSFTCLMVQKESDTPMQSAFAAIVEPYLGTPIIASRRLLSVADNEADAERAVAVEVVTTNGHTDLCFADGRPEKMRSVLLRDGQPPIRIAGEFAYYSTDAAGFRQASLSGGTLLEAPGVSLRPAARERSGKVVKVDYLTKTLWIDSRWPARTTPAAFEIGLPGRWTAYMSMEVAPEGNGTRIRVQNGADYFRSGIASVNEAEGIVECLLNPTMGARAGTDKEWVASDDDMTTFWRADIIGAKRFRLRGAPVKEAAFGKARALRLWEYGVGDTVRQSTFVSLRRMEPGLFELAADVDASITLTGVAAEISTDGKTWRPAGKRMDRGLELEVKTSDLSAEGTLYLRVK